MRTLRTGLSAGGGGCDSLDKAWYVSTSLEMAFPPNTPPEQRLVVSLYEAYCDESGLHGGSEYVVVAGFIAKAEEWTALSVEWQAHLKDCGIEYFHMSEFESRLGPYASWTDEDARRARLNRFLDIIHAHVFESVACVVSKQVFDSAMSPEAKWWCGDAYGLAAISCFYLLGLEAKYPRVHGLMKYIMDRGNQGFSALNRIYSAGKDDPEWYENTRMLSLGIEDKKIFLPLQAACLLAYEVYKQTFRELETDTRPQRYPLRQLKRTPHFWTVAGNDLMEVNEYLTARPRSRQES